MKNALHTIALAGLAALSLNAQAGDYSHSAPTANGYDVVSYQTEKRPLRGNGHFVATHEGATYLFVNQANLEAFNADPGRYAPAYGGYCAFGVSVGKKFIGDPEVWRLVEGKLYFNLDANIQADWLKDVPGRIVKADANWPAIADKDPKAL